MSSNTLAVNTSKPLTSVELEKVNGAALANMSMGVAGAATRMEACAMGNWNNLSGSGFMSAAGGFAS